MTGDPLPATKPLAKVLGQHGPRQRRVAVQHPGGC
jgi:hypothetical protein